LAVLSIEPQLGRRPLAEAEKRLASAMPVVAIVARPARRDRRHDARDVAPDDPRMAKTDGALSRHNFGLHLQHPAASAMKTGMADSPDRDYRIGEVSA
jgi:hypothetical protein